MKNILLFEQVSEWVDGLFGLFLLWLRFSRFTILITWSLNNKENLQFIVID